LSRIRRRRKSLVYGVAIIGAAALVLTSVLGALVMPGLGGSSGNTGFNRIAELEYQVSQYENNLENTPENFYLLTQLGNTYYALGMEYSLAENEEKTKASFAAAMEPYGRALEVQPDDVNVRVDRAVSAFWSDNYDVAEAEFTKAIEIDPTHAKAYFNFGIFQYLGLNQPQAALENWKQVVELNPADDQDLVNTTKSWIAQVEEDLNWSFNSDGPIVLPEADDANNADEEATDEVKQD
jgi:tetratricopeptide (TPR) repeat protein